MDCKTMTCAKCPAWNKSIFSEFTEEELKQLASLKIEMFVARNEIVFRQGDATNGLYCIGTGGIKVLQKNKNEAEKIVRLAPPGDTVGHRSIFLDKQFKGSAVALAGSKLCFISMENINRMLNENTTFARKLITRMAAEINTTEQAHYLHKQKNVRERFAQFLIKLMAEYSQDQATTIDLKLSRSEIAQLVGAAEDTIIRLFSEFREEGWIEENDKKINIIRPDMLKKLAEID